MFHHSLDQSFMVQQMRDELTENGFTELCMPDEVDQELSQTAGTTLLMINSVCGCAAGSARPGVVLSLAHEPRPDRLLTVFAGQDREATDRAREYLVEQPISSPAVALLRDGQVRYMMHRHQIEGRDAETIARDLVAAYERVCGQ